MQLAARLQATANLDTQRTTTKRITRNRIGSTVLVRISDIVIITIAMLVRITGIVIMVIAVLVRITGIVIMGRSIIMRVLPGSTVIMVAMHMRPRRRLGIRTIILTRTTRERQANRCSGNQTKRTGREQHLGSDHWNSSLRVLTPLASMRTTKWTCAVHQRPTHNQLARQ
jgi:hypothetical protein